MLHSHATIPLWGAWTSLQEPGTKRQWSGGCWRRSVINMAYATPNQIATSAIATTLTPTPSASITSHLCREMTFSRRHLLLTYLFMRAEPDLHWNNFTYSIHLIATCLLNVPTLRISVSKTYKWLTEKYPSYQYTKRKIRYILRYNSKRTSHRLVIANEHCITGVLIQYSIYPRTELKLYRLFC